MGCGISKKALKDVSPTKVNQEEVKLSHNTVSSNTPANKKTEPSAAVPQSKPNPSVTSSKSNTSSPQAKPQEPQQKPAKEEKPLDSIKKADPSSSLQKSQENPKPSVPENNPEPQKKAQEVPKPASKDPHTEPVKMHEEVEPAAHSVTKNPKNIEENKLSAEGQAGGHAGTLIFEGNKLLKKAKKGEFDFFEWLYSPSQNDPLMIEMRKYAPAYHGSEERNGERYISMENLLTGYEHPSIMDCKLGRITWTPHHTEETKKNQEAKNKGTTTGSLGFRISGIVVKDEEGKKVESWAKNEGFFGIDENNIHEQFAKIVTIKGEVNKNAIETFIEGTKQILEWFQRQKVKHFVASSVFYVCGKNQKHQVRYIDFAHAMDANGVEDTNVIEGLQNVIKIWERLRGPAVQEATDIVAGHKDRFIFRGDKLLKATSKTEIDFYKEVYQENCHDQKLVELRQFLPKFYGVETISNKNYIVIENLLFHYQNPSILDCKIGKITWAPTHSIEKQRRKQNKAVTSTSGTLSWKISGLLIRNGEVVTEVWNKDQGYSHVNQDNAFEQLAKLARKNDFYCKDILNYLLLETENLINWFKSQHSKLFFTSSLLYVVSHNKIHVKLIDFEYTINASGKPDNSSIYLDYIKGLTSLAENWKRVMLFYEPRVRPCRGPYEVNLEQSRPYYYCDCGRSKKQPFCDGSHKGTQFLPLGFMAKETKTYYLCGCKNSKNKPFCDGSHNTIEW